MSVYLEGVLALMGINILMALSVYAIFTTDQLSLGNAGFMAIGAYTSAYLTVKSGVPILPAVVIGALTASLSGVVIGIPAFRLKGMYLVMATLGFAEVVRTFFLNFEPTGGAYGFRGPFGATLPMIGGWVLVFLVFFWLLSRSRLGRSLDAVQDNEEVASTIGLDVMLLKVGVFCLEPLLPGLRGASMPITCFTSNPIISTFSSRPWPSFSSSWGERTLSGGRSWERSSSVSFLKCYVLWGAGAFPFTAPFWWL